VQVTLAGGASLLEYVPLKPISVEAPAAIVPS
jgi:hypothetical protein